MIKKLVLLPGMDGTGELFADFVDALPDIFETEVVRYPTDNYYPYAELMALVRAASPSSEPFVLLAESFSTPLAIQFAAAQPPNLRALVLCAGFATSPVCGWKRLLCSLLAPVLFRFVLPRSAASLLVGPNAPSQLLADFQTAVSSVKPKVLSARLRAVLTCDARAELREVAVPILYIQAERDRLLPASCLDDIRRIKPQTAAIAIAGPHLLLQREPQRAAAAVAGFIRRLESAN